MKLIIIIASVCTVVATLAPTFASTSYASTSNITSGAGLLAPFPEPVATTGGESLLDKEIAVLTRKGISPARAIHVIQVQGLIARADIVRKVEGSMAGEFAGVWFEPGEARLRVGAISLGGRHAAEDAIAQAGLSRYVSVTPVRSTMAQLLAVQHRWNQKLTSLFEREDVETGIEPQRNAVFIRLSSSVPVAERNAISREAAAASVNIYVSVVESIGISLAPQAKTECNIFEKGKANANCERSVTAGVGIENEKGASCTAGPVAVPLANRFERVLLTAGHCGNEGESWKAFTKAGAGSKIGKAKKFVDGGASGAKKGDYGEISIEPEPNGFWQTGMANDPVFAVTAEWKVKEGISYPVKGESLPVVKNTSCHDGQVSGETCGEIQALNVTLLEEGLFTEGLVEASGENLSGESGDSGGPWMSVEANKEVSMEGTFVGIVYECAKLAEVKKGPKFFKTRPECAGFEFLEKEGNEGEWERKAYTCTEKAEVKEGANFYEAKAECEKNKNAGKGKFERTPAAHLLYQPLRQPVGGAAEGSLEALKLELLTTANEVIPGRWDVNGTTLLSTAALSGTALVLAHGSLKIPAAGVSIVCSSKELGITGGELVAPNELRAKDLTFKECKVEEGGAVCKLASTAILTLAIHGSATLDGTLNSLVLALPLPSKTLAVLSFEGATCALTGAQPLTTTKNIVDLLIHKGRDPEVLHLVLVSSLKGLKVGSNEAELAGLDIDLRLESGQTWNFL